MKLILNDDTSPEEVVTLYLTKDTFGFINLEARDNNAPFSPKTLLRFSSDGIIETVRDANIGTFHFDKNGSVIVNKT